MRTTFDTFGQRALVALTLLFAHGVFVAPVHATDLTKGLMYAVPTPGGKAPVIDGNLNDWDLSAAEPTWISAQTAGKMNASAAIEYDDDAIYVSAHVKIPGDKFSNVNDPVDPYWIGDEVELRLSSDPSLKFPIQQTSDPAVKASDRICHLTFWQNTANGKDYLNITYGADFDKGRVVNPAGSSLAVKSLNGEYILEARIPWSALNVPGGKNPYGPGKRMTAIWGLHWKQGAWFVSGNLNFTNDPGDFAFHQAETWGQIEFSPTGKLPKRHVTMAEALAAKTSAALGVPISVDVPSDGKLSVSILGPNGEVLRELTGGQPVKMGKFTAVWDGFDQWGFPLAPGKYKWGAYFSHGLQARYHGFVGSSGNPPYATLDNKGGWGGDHDVPCGVATDATGVYLAWTGGEAQSHVLKLDPAGQVVWRKSPLISVGHTAVATNGKYLYIVSGESSPKLARLDCATGALAAFGGDTSKAGDVPLPIGAPTHVDETSSPVRDPDGNQPESLGVAVTEREIYVPLFSQNKILVLDAATAERIRELPCAGPRGLALDRSGNLYAVSYVAGKAPTILMYANAAGSGKAVVATGLDAPVGLCIDGTGTLFVSDNGASQQLKAFVGGKLVRTYGIKGGRPLEGGYDGKGFLKPFGVAVDSAGNLFVAEASIPKIFSRIDAKTGVVAHRWFGWPGYGLSNIPDSDDPYTNYFPYEPRGFGRATAALGKSGMPDAYWDIVEDKAYPECKFGNLPFIERLNNGRKYEIADTWPHFVHLVEDDKMLPVGYIKVLNANEKIRGVTYNATSQGYIEVWSDQNGDHLVQPDELTRVTEIDGKPLPNVFGPFRWSCLWMDKAGNAYLQTWGNSIIKIPSDGLAKSGAINWNAAKANYVVPAVFPAGSSGNGAMGVRADSKGNIYVATTSTQPALTPQLQAKLEQAYPTVPRTHWGVFPDAEIAKEQHQGLSHTAESNAVKFAKYAPDGHMLWIAGRKAVAAPNPGEMYNTWTMAGMVGDDYVSSSSEWGNMYVYTSDGFFVDTLMNDSAALPPPGPYTFGSETFGGRIQGFPKLGKVFAYNQGGIYIVDGFDKTLHVEGEKRVYGEVVLDKVYNPVSAAQEVQSIVIARLTGPSNLNASWNEVPTATLGKPEAHIATAQVAYDDAKLYARLHVADATPLQNGADDLALAFKGGDAAGIDLGPVSTNAQPAAGDIRLLATMIGGKAHLIAMKPVSAIKSARDYVSPVGDRHFDFVGDVPGGEVSLMPDADGKGYAVSFSVPRSFLDFAVTPGSNLRGDIEVLASGSGMRGLQAVQRNWLFSSGRSETTMTDDIPTESWLYPSYWGTINVR
ncbi:MAG TPA: hypothetical protein VGK19_06105 [Capsulimonadaceae bacterium]|jgi:hypothetical protein